MEWRRLIEGNTKNGQQVPDPAPYGGNCGATTITVPSDTQVKASVLAKNCNGPGPGGLPAGIVQGQAFPNNTIPACMIDPNATALVTAGIFPAPTIGNKFFGSVSTPTNLKEEAVRLDHNFTSKFSVFAHFVAKQVTQSYPISQWSAANVPTVADTFRNPTYTAAPDTTPSTTQTL